MGHQITSHQDGLGLNDSIEIFGSDPGPGGAPHYYYATMKGKDGEKIVEGDHEDKDSEAQTYRPLEIQFQEGPRHEEGSKPGVTTNAVLAVVLDHLQGFQSNIKARNAYNDETIRYIELAMSAQRKRAEERNKRGVLGTDKA